METANKDVKGLQAQHSETSISMRVQKMAVKHEDSQSRACYRCGSLQHLANECRFISENVTIVGNKDTNKNVDQKVPQGKQSYKGEKDPTHPTHYVSREEKSAPDEEDILTVHSLKGTEIVKLSSVTITLNVNESNAQFEVDTGWWCDVMNNFSKLWKEDFQN